MARKKPKVSREEAQPVVENTAGCAHLPIPFSYELTEDFSFNWKAEFGIVKKILLKAGEVIVHQKVIDVLIDLGAPLILKE